MGPFSFVRFLYNVMVWLLQDFSCLIMTASVMINLRGIIRSCVLRVEKQECSS